MYVHLYTSYISLISSLFIIIWFVYSAQISTKCQMKMLKEYKHVQYHTMYMTTTVCTYTISKLIGIYVLHNN